MWDYVPHGFKRRVTWRTRDMAAHGWPAQKAHRARQVAGRPRGHVGARVERHVWLALERERKSTRGGLASVRCGMSGGDRVDPSPRDHQIHHVRQKELK